MNLVVEGGGTRPITRRRALALGGASVAAAAVIAACGSDDSPSPGDTSQFGDGDVGILNYLLTMEYVEAAFYKAALATGLLDGPESEATQARATMARFGEQEVEHVAAVTKAIERLEGDPVKEPGTEFPLRTTQGVLELGGQLENLGTAAYLGQIPRIENPAALATMLSIHTVEGRHAAKMGAIVSGSLKPGGAFAKPAGAKAVIEAIEPFLAS
jgi:hypothetical protein